MLFLQPLDGKLFQASATTPSSPVVVQSNLKFLDESLIYQFAPLKIHPFSGLAVNPAGTRIYVNQTKPDNILLITRTLKEKKDKKNKKK
jgi:hypothetical protein